MNNYEIAKLGEEMINLIKILIGVQALIFFAWLAQLIANLTIIVQLPKIKKYQKRIFQKLYNFENERIIDYKIEKMEEEEEENKKSERMEALKSIYENKETSEETELEKNKPASLKETIEYIIAAVLVTINIIALIIITGKK